MPHPPSADSPNPPADTGKPRPSKPKPVAAQSLRQGHEPANVGVKFIFAFAGGFILLFAGILWGTMGVFKGVSRDATTASPSTEHGDIRPAATRLEPSPGHQEQDWQHLARLREADQAIFKSRGWAGDDGQVRVPAAVAARVSALSRRPPTSRPTTGRATPYDEGTRP